MKGHLLGFLSILIITQLNSQQYTWTGSMGGANDEFFNSIVVDNSGNVYIAGSFNDTVDFDPGPGISLFVSSGTADAFIAKYDASGNYLWAKVIGSVGYEYISSMEINTSNQLMVTGSFSGTVDFDPGVGTSNLTATGGDVFFWCVRQ